MKCWPFITLLLFLLSAQPVLGQRMEFEMSVFGIRFGTMIVVRTVNPDGSELYTVNAKGKTDFLWMKREEESRHRVLYREGVLHSSEYVYLNRGEREKWANIRLVDGQYQVETHEGTRSLKGVTDYSLAKFYFEPDWQRTTVFCEEDCAFSTMRSDRENGIITVTCKDGNRSTYRLRDGAIQEMDIHLQVATVKLRRIG
jgi:hypothetical protein